MDNEKVILFVTKSSVGSISFAKDRECIEI